MEKDTNGTLDLSFLPRTGNKIIFNVSNRVLVVGDLKFFAQMLSREKYEWILVHVVPFTSK